jgi:hypothetical protein
MSDRQPTETTNLDGHGIPPLSVRHDGGFYVVSGPGTRRSRNPDTRRRRRRRALARSNTSMPSSRMPSFEQ